MSRVLSLGVFVILSVSAISCGRDEAPIEPRVPAPYPVKATPEGAIQRFIATYEAMDTTEYFKLFTKDFIFEFSSSTDPDLVNKFSAGWYKDDELISWRNLFVGGVNSEGQFLVPATSIDLNLHSTQPSPFAPRGGDPGAHQRLLTSLDLAVHLPPTQAEPEGITFVVGGVDPAEHEFFLVRGEDAELGSDQPADSTHWYIYKWRDATSGPYGRVENDAASGMLQSVSPTWGRLKGLYR